MTPQELESAGERLFGENWKGLITDALGIDASTRWRMLQKKEITGPVAVVIKTWLLLEQGFSILPPLKPLNPYRSKNENPITGEDADVNVFQIAELIFGEQWKMKLSDFLGINHSTLWRQMEANDYPDPVIAALRALHLLKVLTGSISGVETEKDLVVKNKKKQSKYADLLD